MSNIYFFPTLLLQPQLPSSMADSYRSHYSGMSMSNLSSMSSSCLQVPPPPPTPLPLSPTPPLCMYLLLPSSLSSHTSSHLLPLLLLLPTP